MERRSRTTHALKRVLDKSLQPIGRLGIDGRGRIVDAAIIKDCSCEGQTL